MIELKLIDRVEAARVILDPEIYDRISNDKCPEYFELPDIPYWGGYVNGELASLNIEGEFRDGIKIHFQVLKNYRKHARELLEISIKDIDYPIYAEIPTCFQSTINFALKAGFRTIEIKPENYLKYGKLHDRYLMRLDHEFHH